MGAERLISPLNSKIRSRDRWLWVLPATRGWAYSSQRGDRRVTSNSLIPELVPARMLNEYAYCPRLAYLEWVQGEFADSADTVEGRFQHRRVDRPSGRLPSRSGGDPADRAEQDEESRETIHACSVTLSDEDLGAIARIDLIEGQGNAVTPVDYKRGTAPDVPEGAWEPERVQICIQGLLLRANGYTCTQGMLYFVESRQRVAVPFDDALVSRTLELLSGIRGMAASGLIPEPLVDSPKCPRCSQLMKAYSKTWTHKDTFLRKALAAVCRQQPPNSRNYKSQRWPNLKEVIPLMLAWSSNHG